MEHLSDASQEERILSEKRRHRDLPFDVWPLRSCSLGDLSKPIFEGEYLPNAFAPDVLEANERTYEERLAACRMVVAFDDPTPTVLGVLVVGVSPRTWLPCSYIQFLRVQGRVWGDPIVDEEVIDGALSTLLRRLDDKLRAQLATRVDISRADTEVRQSDYPLNALQQLARNAVMRRILVFSQETLVVACAQRPVTCARANDCLPASICPSPSSSAMQSSWLYLADYLAHRRFPHAVFPRP